MLAGHYEAPLVIVSMVVAVFASYTALTLASRVSQTAVTSGYWWMVGGAFAMGTGIWAMHFIGMLAFRLPIPLGYDLAITLVSWVLPVLVSGVALWQLSRARLDTARLLASAVLIGAGINLMHYIGMAAMRMEPDIVWNWWLVAASVLIAVASAAAALWLAFRLRDERRPRVALARAAAAVFMGTAIVGMHYTGMAAASFPSDSLCLAAQGAFGLTQLAVLVIVATIGVLAIALLSAVYDARLEARGHILAASERLSRERELLLASEREARAEAERLSSLKDEFLATLSHELRTPLNAVLGWAQLLRIKKDEESVRTGLDTIERNARLQAQLIDDLLDMSRIVSGKLRIQSEPVDAAAIVQAAIASVQPMAFSKGVEIATHVDAAGTRILGDPARLEQVMWNLLTNAVKFTPAGGHIHVRLRSDRPSVEITVADDGEGIDPGFLPHVFEKFRQADASTTRRQGGLGLGLAIVRQLVDLHGGTVSAHSEGEGRGATFTVRLPVAGSATQVLAGNVPAPSDRRSTADEVRLEGVKVLVVDDEPDTLQVTQALLTSCGARSVVASSAKAALELLERERPQLLVSDIAMPDVDGYELVRRLRRHTDARLARIPAIALSAFTRSEDIARAREAGFDAHVAKPLDTAVLLKALGALNRLAQVVAG
jgi:signal transduction histidine kinase/CheY-like chemotaxis protein